MSSIRVTESNYACKLTLLKSYEIEEAWITPFELTLEISFLTEETIEDPYINLSVLTEYENILKSLDTNYGLHRFPKLKELFSILGQGFRLEITKGPLFHLDCEFIYVEYKGEIHSLTLITEEEIKNLE